jgi:hypothetical protein
MTSDVVPVPGATLDDQRFGLSKVVRGDRRTNLGHERDGPGGLTGENRRRDGPRHCY